MNDRRWLAGFTALCVGQFLAHQTALSFSALIPILRDEWHLSVMVISAARVGIGDLLFALAFRLLEAAPARRRILSVSL